MKIVPPSKPRHYALIGLCIGVLPIVALIAMSPFCAIVERTDTTLCSAVQTILAPTNIILMPVVFFLQKFIYDRSIAALVSMAISPFFYMLIFFCFGLIKQKIFGQKVQ